MPSEWHDYTTRFFEEHPALAGRILRDYMGVSLPPDSEMKVVPSTVNTRPSDDLWVPDLTEPGARDHGGTDGNDV
jgi:hypothetical protein